jgi:ATP-dependent helicase/nuclease subunit B
MNESPLAPRRLNVYASSSLLHQALKDEMHEGPLIGHRHILYPRFLCLLALYDRARHAHISSMAARALIKNLAESLFAGGQGYFRPLLHFKGMVTVIADFIQEMQEAGVDAGELTAAAEGMDKRQKWRELALLYRAYRVKLKKLKVGDSSARKARLIELLESTSAMPFIDRLREIHFKSFYKLTELDFRLIVALAERGGRNNQQVVIHLSYDPLRQDAFRFLERTVAHFESLADTPQNLTLDFSGLLSPPEEPASLSFLKEHIFRQPDELLQVRAAENDGSLALLKAPAPEGELDEICREIRRLLEKGVKPGEITIAFRSLSHYGPLAFEASRRFALPFTFPYGNALLSSHLVRTLLAPFHIVQSAYSVREVLKFVFSRYIDISPMLKGSRLTRQDFEILVSESGIIDDETASWEHALEKLVKRMDDNRLDRSSGPLIRKARLLGTCIGKLRKEWAVFHKNREKPEQFRKALQKTVRTFRVRQIILKSPALLAGTEWPLFLLQRDLSALQTFSDILMDVEKSFAMAGITGKVTGEDFYDTLVEGLREKNLAAPGEQDGIAVMNVQDCAGYRTDYLFMGGLTEGSFPVRHYEDALFKDSEKEALSLSMGRKLFQSTSMRHWEENLLFFLALASARKGIYLSYSAADENGAAVLPSYFLEQAMRFVKTEEPPGLENSTSLAPPPRLIFRSREIVRYITGNIWRPSRGENALAVTLLRNYGEMGDRELLHNLFLRCDAEQSRDLFMEASHQEDGSPYMGLITDTNAIKGLLPSREGHPVWSASQLEDYGKCPFVFFMRILLGLEKRPLPDEDMDPRSEGTLLHEILEYFYREMAGEGRLPLTGAPDEESTLMEITLDRFENWAGSRPTGDPFFWELRRELISRTLRGWLSFEQRNRNSLVPAFFELDFGRSSPFTISDAEGHMHFFKGFIDRLDVDEKKGAFRVVDYKNSASTLYRKKIQKDQIGKESIQIPLYTYAAEHLLLEKGLLLHAPVRREACYGLLKKPAFVTQPFTDEVFTGYFLPPARKGHVPSPPEGARNFAAEICGLVERILSGRFQPEGVNCLFCDYFDLCRYSP